MIFELLRIRGEKMLSLLLAIGFAVFIFLLFDLIMSEKRDKAKYFGILAGFFVLTAVGIGAMEVFSFLESCDSCIKGIGAMG